MPAKVLPLQAETLPEKHSKSRAKLQKDAENKVNHSVPDFPRGLFQFFLQVLHFIIEIVEAVDLQVIADATAVGCDGLVVGDAIKTEELLQTGEFGIDEANCRLVSQPLFDILMIGLAALGGALSSNEDEVHDFHYVTHIILGRFSVIHKPDSSPFYFASPSP